MEYVPTRTYLLGKVSWTEALASTAMLTSTPPPFHHPQQHYHCCRFSMYINNPCSEMVSIFLFSQYSFLFSFCASTQRVYNMCEKGGVKERGAKCCKIHPFSQGEKILFTTHTLRGAKIVYHLWPAASPTALPLKPTMSRRRIPLSITPPLIEKKIAIVNLNEWENTFTFGCSNFLLWLSHRWASCERFWRCLLLRRPFDGFTPIEGRWIIFYQ